LLFSSAFFLFPLPHIAIAALLSLSTNSVFSLSSIYLYHFFDAFGN
jgi:hypothetical protein